MTTFRSGVLPNDPTKPRLRLGPHLAGYPYPMPPAAVNWDRAVASWPLMANDVVSDCVFAMIGHTIQTWTANASREVVLTDADVLAAYSAVTGYNPADPATDNGTVMQDAFNYWRKTGIAGHKILAFAEVNHTSSLELKAAISLFGEVLLAVDLPDTAMGQFDAGQPWDVVDGATSEGGHAICAARYDAAAPVQWTVITWGREQPVTTRFLSKYLREAWIAISPEWVEASGQTPSGLDLHGMGEDFAALTGDPNPFAPPPGPPPPHVVGLVAAARTLAGDQAVLDWLRHPHLGHARHVAALVRSVVDAVRDAA